MLELDKRFKVQHAIDYLNTQSTSNQERILTLLEYYNEGGKDNVFKIPMKPVTGLFAVIEVTHEPFKIVKCELMSSRMIINYDDEQIRVFERLLVRTLQGINLIAISDLYTSTFTELDHQLDLVMNILKPQLEIGFPNFSRPFNKTPFDVITGKSGELMKGVRTVFPLTDPNNEVVITMMEDSNWDLHYHINGFTSRLYPAGRNDEPSSTWGDVSRNIKHCVYSRSVIIDAILTLRLRAIELFGVC